MVVMVEALNCAMSVAVGTVPPTQLLPMFQSLLPGVRLQTGGPAGVAVMTRKTSRAPWTRLRFVAPVKLPVVARLNVPVRGPVELSTGKMRLAV